MTSLFARARATFEPWLEDRPPHRQGGGSTADLTHSARVDAAAEEAEAAQQAAAAAAYKEDPSRPRRGWVQWRRAEVGGSGHVGDDVAAAAKFWPGGARCWMMLRVEQKRTATTQLGAKDGLQGASVAAERQAGEVATLSIFADANAAEPLAELVLSPDCVVTSLMNEIACHCLMCQGCHRLECI